MKHINGPTTLGFVALRRIAVSLLVILFCSVLLYSQSGSINNTLGSGGTFTIKDGSTTFLSLDQTSGHLSLTKSLILPGSTGSTLGVIFKGTDRFIHDYKANGTSGGNTFIGLNAGNFTLASINFSESSYNTAVGDGSLNALTTGYRNSAFGYYALQNNTTGYRNAAFGYSSLLFNTTGLDNCAFGTNALYKNQTGQNNSAFGHYALADNEASGNSAFGYLALENNSTGENNCAFGFRALFNNSGNKNTAIGYYAGEGWISGSNNTLIGSWAQPSSSTVSNEITLGNDTVTTLRCAVTTITSLSDARDKSNIRELPLGLDFLMSVKPRLFNWDRREWYENKKVDGIKMQKTPTAGFIAQELDKAQTNAKAEWLNLVLKSNPERLEATPGNLLPIMVKAIQELKTENDELKNELIILRASLVSQVKEEVKKAILKELQQEEATTKVSLN